MKGRIFNSANGWIMSYKSEISGSPNMIPLHPDDCKSDGGFNWDLSMKEGREVEFEIVNECAKLVETNQTTTTTNPLREPPYVSDDFQIGPQGAYEHVGWDEVFANWMGHNSYSKTVDGLQEYLEKNYYEPNKK